MSILFRYKHDKHGQALCKQHFHTAEYHKRTDDFAQCSRADILEQFFSKQQANHDAPQAADPVQKHGRGIYTIDCTQYDIDRDSKKRLTRCIKNSLSEQQCYVATVYLKGSKVSRQKRYFDVRRAITLRLDHNNEW